MPSTPKQQSLPTAEESVDDKRPVRKRTRLSDKKEVKQSLPTVEESVDDKRPVRKRTRLSGKKEVKQSLPTEESVDDDMKEMGQSLSAEESVDDKRREEASERPKKRPRGAKAKNYAELSDDEDTFDI